MMSSTLLNDQPGKDTNTHLNERHELQPLLESDRASVQSEESGLSDGIIASGAAAAIGVRWRLYISHFLSTWNSRVFEFGAVLFIAKIFPGTLLPVSVYAVVRSASAIVFSPMVGRYIDGNDRLHVVRTSIVVQRASVAISCVAFWILLVFPHTAFLLKTVLLVVSAVLACSEKLAAVMNTLAVERDWVIVIAGAETDQSSLQGLMFPGFLLKYLNSQMRRIDLFCKLVGPLLISLVDGIATDIAILVTLAITILSVGIEYFSIAQVYQRVPALCRVTRLDTTSQRERSNSQDSGAGLSEERAAKLNASCLRGLWRIKLYFRHRDFLPSMALSVLHFTVLSFGGQLITYLLSVGYNSTQIGIIRTISVTFELSATWAGPILMSRVGVVRAALWSINWQMSCIATAVMLFITLDVPFFAASGLIAGVIGSRLGLWVFDLCVQNIVQEEVEADRRGSFSAMEASFQNGFELCAYASTIVFARPAQFRYPVLLSSLAVFVASALYTKFVRDRRGHLLHMSKCLKGRSRADGRSRARPSVVG